MPSLLDISILVAGFLFLPIWPLCFFPGVMEHSPACLDRFYGAASLAHPMTQHQRLIEGGKDLTLVLLCAWAYLQTSVASKKAVATLMSIHNLWAAFVAHGLASPEVPCIICLGSAALMVAAILTAPDAKAGKKK